MDNTVSTLQVEIADVSRLIYSGACRKLAAPAAHGEVCILPRHAPLLTALKPGEIRLQTASGEDCFLFVAGGYMEVKDSTISILADEILRSEDLDLGLAQQAREQAEQVLRESHFRGERDAAKLDLAKALAQLRVLQHAELHRLRKSEH